MPVYNMLPQSRGGYTELLNTTISNTGTLTLSDSVDNYKGLLICISNGTEWKAYPVIPLMYNDTLDVSWNATDNVGWYIIVTCQLNGNSLYIGKFQRRNFTVTGFKVYGIK